MLFEVDVFLCYHLNRFNFLSPLYPLYKRILPSIVDCLLCCKNNKVVTEFLITCTTVHLKHRR